VFAVTPTIHVTSGEGLATWIVAFATVSLFVATGLLFWATKRMVTTAAKQVGIEQDRIAAGQHPHVYPVTLDPWVTTTPPYADGRARHVIPLANAGPGIAHNTTGILVFSDGVFSPIFPLTIQPGQELDARLDFGGGEARGLEGWKNAHGFLVYDDLVGVKWMTEYNVRQSNGGSLFFEFQWSGLLSDFGDLTKRFNIPASAMRGEMNNTLDRAISASVTRPA